MTLTEFFDRVPWQTMRVTAKGMIRQRGTNKCPICAVFGGRNAQATHIALGHAVSNTTSIVLAADEPTDWILRPDMLRRMRETHR